MNDPSEPSDTPDDADERLTPEEKREIGHGLERMARRARDDRARRGETRTECVDACHAYQKHGHLVIRRDDNELAWVSSPVPVEVRQ